MKTLFCILTTNKYKTTRQQVLKDTWLAGRDYVFASDIDDGEQIKLSDKTDHSSAEEKQLNIFPVLMDRYQNYDRYFFCDDDTFINTKIYDKIFLSPSVGHVLSRDSDPENPLWYNKPYFKYFSGGAGFVLSKILVERIARHIPHYNTRTRYGDISVGEIMDILSIKKIDCPLFHKDKPSVYNHSDNDIRNNLTYHYIKEDAMRDLWRIVNV